MKTRANLTNYGIWKFLLLNFLLVFATACEKDTSEIDLNVQDASAKKNLNSGPYVLEGRIFDIAATPDGSIMFGVNTDAERSIQIIKNGDIKTVAILDTDTDINGIATIGTGNGYATTAGTDEAMDGELIKFSMGGSEIVADLAAFEREVDPDALQGIQWKDGECEASPVYTAGPQNNPYNVARLSGSEVLVADAAGNSVLKANDEGYVDWFAILTPPTDENGDWIELGAISDEIICYAQPVPTAVTVGTNGYVYIGELTGAFSEGLPIGYSRIWKVPADANNVTCMTGGSGDCELLIDNLTSVIDLAIGPDELLYVVEYDKFSWLTAYGVEDPNNLGGTISAYTLDGEFVETVESGLSFPSAITFDNKGNLWLLENNFVVARPDLKPTIRMIEQ